MKSMQKGLIVALIHLALVCSLGAKLLYDRATRPRIWVRSFSYDPNLPIRGRYVALRAVVETDLPAPEPQKTPQVYPGWQRARLEVRNGKLYAVKDDNGSVDINSWNLVRNGRGEVTTAVSEPSLFFIPDTAKDPTWLKPGETLWFEATIPKKGPPRPIRLAVSKADGTFTPLDLK